MVSMKINDKVDSLRNQSKKHKHYELLAKKSGVGYSWLSKFVNESIENPTVANLIKLEDYFLNESSVCSYPKGS